MILKKISVFLAAISFAAPALAAVCQPLEHENRGYVVCEATSSGDLRLFLQDADGDILGSFGSVETMLSAQGKTLAFAMNAGMYHSDRRPVGLYIEDGDQQTPIVTRSGPGNFGLLPNGVFCVGDTLAVFESQRFAERPPECRYATQSGPMLVIDGGLHPRFLVDSTSRYIRNGVGVTEDGEKAFFAISDRPVTFHEFGRLFRDVLQTPNALYFDGRISRLYAPALGRDDFGFQMGPMVGLVIPDG